MKKQLLNYLWIAMTGFAFMSCKKAATTNANGNMAYRITATNSMPASKSVAVLSATGGSNGTVVAVNPALNLNWTSGHIDVAEVKLKAKKENLDIMYKAKGLTNIDLFNLGPVFGNLTIPDGLYKKVELSVEVEKSNTAAPLVLRGSYTNPGGTIIPVELSVNEEMEFEVESKDITVSGANSYLGLITLHLPLLTAGISPAEFDAATRNQAGVIIISSTSNVTLYNKIKANAHSIGDVEFEDDHHEHGEH